MSLKLMPTDYYEAAVEREWDNIHAALRQLKVLTACKSFDKRQAKTSSPNDEKLCKATVRLLMELDKQAKLSRKFMLRNV